MRPHFAALTVMIVSLLSVMSAHAADPNAVYRAVSPAQMMELLKSSGATDVREMHYDNKTFVWAETPVGAIEVGFADCHEQPNPCGYILMKRYRNLALTPAQLQQFNRAGGLSYAFRAAGSNDVVIAYPVAVRTGLSRAYIVSTFGLMSGLSEVFEGFATGTLHIKPERLYSHAE